MSSAEKKNQEMAE